MKWTVPPLVLAMLLAVWEGLCLFLDVPRYVLPRPTAIGAAAWSNGELIGRNVGITSLLALCGLVAGLTLAFISASIMSYWSRLGATFSLYLVGLQSIPVVALAPYFLIWFGPGYAGRVIMAMLIVYVPASLILWNGFRRVDRDIGTLLRAFAVPKATGFFRYRIPLAVPFVVTAIEVTASLAIIGAIVAELAGASDGVGAVVIRASYSMKIDLVFAVLLAAAIVAAAIYGGSRLLSQQIKATFSLEVPSRAV